MSAATTDDTPPPFESGIVLAVPASLRFFAAVACALILTIGALLMIGDFARKERISGELGYVSGSAKVFPPIAGVVTKVFVEEGSQVKAGEQLALIKVDRSGEDGRETHAITAEQLKVRRDSLLAERERIERINREEAASLKQKLADLHRSYTHVQAQLAAQREQTNLGESVVKRYAELVRQNFASALQLEQAQQSYYEQLSRMHSMEHELLSLGSDVTTARTASLNLPIRAKNDAAQIDRSIAEIDQQAADNAEKQTLLITATQDGIVTALQGDTGQPVSPAAPLLTIIPQGAELEAVFYVPSRAIGFVAVGKPVLLRYQAFPYQKFGQYAGTVSEVTRTALSPSEAQIVTSERETLFRVTVSLQSQHASAFGSPVELKDGMRVDADVVLEKRKLYEWILEPIFDLKGKLST